MNNGQITELFYFNFFKKNYSAFVKSLFLVFVTKFRLLIPAAVTYYLIQNSWKDFSS